MTTDKEVFPNKNCTWCRGTGHEYIDGGEPHLRGHDYRYKCRCITNQETKPTWCTCDRDEHYRECVGQMVHESTKEATPRPIIRITQDEVCYILNEILGSYWILWPFNHRYKAQIKFMEILKQMAIPEEIEKAVNTYDDREKEIERSIKVLKCVNTNPKHFYTCDCVKRILAEKREGQNEQ